VVSLAGKRVIFQGVDLPVPQPCQTCNISIGNTEVVPCHVRSLICRTPSQRRFSRVTMVPTSSTPPFPHPNPHNPSELICMVLINHNPDYHELVPTIAAVFSAVFWFVPTTPVFPLPASPVLHCFWPQQAKRLIYWAKVFDTGPLHAVLRSRGLLSRQDTDTVLFLCGTNLAIR
jgi:hypothetical protein